MIRICRFDFQDYPSPNYLQDFAIFGDPVDMSIHHISEPENIPFELDANEPYQVSLDQSTSNTGMFIKNYRNTQAYMVEFSRSRKMSADDYIFALERLIHKICSKALITHLIYERPISTESYRSSQVLFQLEGMIRSLPRRYDEFRASRLEYIENSSWRRVVICQEYSKLEKKLASEKSIKAIFPWTCAYGSSLGSDRDIFEAMGVMFGWFFNSYDPLGRPYVRGDKFYGNIGGFILPEVSAEEVCKQLRDAGINATWAMENPRKSIFENLVCSVEKYKVVCVELSSPSSMLALTIECNFKWLDPEKMTVVLVASNFVNDTLFDITGDEYHFIL